MPPIARSTASSRGAGRAQRVASHNWGGPSDSVNLGSQMPSLPSLAGMTPAHLAQDARRIDTLHPVMQPRVQGFLQASRMAGYPVVITPTGHYRSPEDHFMQGREEVRGADGRVTGYNVVDPAAVAKGQDESMHNHGMAIDYGFIETNGKMRWQPSDQESTDLARIANRFGLSWGSQPGAKANPDPTHLQWNGAPLKGDAQYLQEGRQDTVDGRTYPQIPNQEALVDQSHRDSSRALNQFANELAVGRRSRGESAGPGQYAPLNQDERRQLLQSLSDIHQNSRIHNVMGLGLEVSHDAQGLRRFIDTEVPGLIPQETQTAPAVPGAPQRMNAITNAQVGTKYGEDLDLTA